MTDMNTNMTTSQYVTAFFDRRDEAEAAVERIVAEGVSRDEIHMIAGDEGSSDLGASEPREDRGFFAALGDLFMPDEDRHTYAEGLSRGGYMVSLYTRPENRERILDILDDEGTVDMDQREASWREEGWSGYQAETSTGAASAERHDHAEGDSIEVVEEQMRIGKRQVEQGRVRVRSYTVDTPVEEQVTLRDETVHVERSAVDRPVTAGSGGAFAEHSLEATETDEEAVVSKEARVVEEVRLAKDVEDHTETVRDSVRHTEVEVDDDRTDRRP